jgi:CheY-like chemotaxis protein
MAQLSAEKKVLQWGGAALQSTRSSRRILVVDDNPAVLKLISRMLEQVGYLVDSADNAHSAMGRLNRSSYDTVVTDLQMPGMNGYALAGWIKDSFKGTNVIVITGSRESDVSCYMNTGIVDFWLFKPFNLIELCKKISEFA